MFVSASKITEYFCGCFLLHFTETSIWISNHASLMSEVIYPSMIRNRAQWILIPASTQSQQSCYTPVGFSFTDNDLGLPTVICLYPCRVNVFSPSTVDSIPTIILRSISGCPNSNLLWSFAISLLLVLFVPENLRNSIIHSLVRLLSLFQYSRINSVFVSMFSNP